MNIENSLVDSKNMDLYAGQKLRDRRIQLGLTQRYLAEKVGITFQQIQKYEKGINRMGVSRLYQFCKILGTKPSYFFSNLSYENQSSEGAINFAEEEDQHLDSKTQISFNEEIIEVIRLYSVIKDPATRKLVLNLLKSLTDNKKREN